MIRKLVLAFLILCVATPAFADDRSTYMAPLKRTGRALNRDMNSWKKSAEDYAGVGDEATDSFMCSDPGFFVVKQEHGITGDETWFLKGVLHVPAAGFMYRYSMLGVRGPEGFAQLQVGQPITSQYREQEPAGPLKIVEELKLPPTVALLHIKVAGGSREQQEIRCDLTSVKPPAAQE